MMMRAGEGQPLLSRPRPLNLIAVVTIVSLFCTVIAVAHLFTQPAETTTTTTALEKAPEYHGAEGLNWVAKAKPTSSEFVSLAVFQGSFKAGQKASNIKTMEFFAQQSKLKNAKFLLFPELSLVSYDSWMHNTHAVGSLAETQDGPSFHQMAAIAKKHDMVITYGYIEKDETKEVYYNSATTISNTGERLINYRKVHLTESEAAVFTPGTSLGPVVDVLGLKVGLLICYDIFLPEPARVLALKGAQLILIPTANERSPLTNNIASQIVPTRAAENGLYIAYSNYAMHTPVSTFHGMSLVCDPTGETIARGAAYLKANQIDNTRVDELAMAMLVRTNPGFQETRFPELYAAITTPMAQLADSHILLPELAQNSPSKAL